MKTLDSMSKVYILNALGKGLSVFYFVLLPVFFAQKLISSTQIGYIGAISITMLIFGALIVAKWLHTIESKKLLQIASVLGVFSSVILLISSLFSNIPALYVSYGMIGLVVGLAISGVKAVSSELTVKGNRYKSMARLSMATDIVRIVFPLIVSAAIIVANVNVAIVLIIISAIILLFISTSLPNNLHKVKVEDISNDSIHKNRNFLYMQLVEFLDSFSSSQLFVFLPLIFLAKGYSIESSLLLQSFIFLGYISGRWLVSLLAHKYSGMRAIAIAEIGMVVTIILLLISTNLFLLYALTYILGIFARGTSPAIEALTFDTLTENQTKKGAALRIVAGDSGSALGQLLFGVIVAFYGVNAPFILSAIIGITVTILCLNKEIKI